MGLKFALISILFLSISWVPLSSQSIYQSFIQCIADQSPGNNNTLLEKIHTPNSATYKSLLQYASKNPRWSNSTAQHPFLIAAPENESEIRPIILCAKNFRHQIRVKSGGHDYEGLSFRSESRFIMLDLSGLNRTIIDLQSESAWVQTGVTLGQLYYEIAKQSNTLAFAGGLCPTVGAGGHISGGGIGTLTRKYGLASDNVLDARVMDVNGDILDRETMGEELFWAIRGGGAASYGVVLAWKLRLVRVPANVTAFTFRRRLEPGNFGLIQKWQNYAHKVFDDLFMRVLIAGTVRNFFVSDKIVQVSYNGLFLGPAEKLVPLLNRTFPEFGLRIEDCFSEPVGNASCSERPCITKECFQLPWIRSVLYFANKKPDNPTEILLEKINKERSNKGASDFLKAPIPDEGWKMIHEMMLSGNSPMMILDPLGGKMDEILEEETPFPHRKGNIYNIQYLSYWGVNTKNESSKHINWIREMRKKMKPYVAQSPRTAYLNYRDLDLGRNDHNCSYDRAKIWGEKYFKGNFERLARVKGKVDPTNFFRNEQSIPVLLQ